MAAGGRNGRGGMGGSGGTGGTEGPGGAEEPEGSGNPDDAPGAVHEEVSALLAAWALGSGMPGDDARVRGHLRDCPPCAAEAQRLRETVRLLDEPAPAGRAAAPGARRTRGWRAAG